MPIPEISTLNERIGICGVVSTIAAVYAARPGAKETIDNSTKNGSSSLVYVYDIICGFLSYLTQHDELEVLQETEAITKSFGGHYATWTVIGYLTRGRLEEHTKAGGYAMALTPKGILALLEFLGMWGVLASGPVVGDAIIGLTRPGAPSNKWNNLAHWAYRSADGTWLNNGKRYSSLDALGKSVGKDYSEVYYISVHG